MENLTNIQLIAGFVGIILVAFSIVGWCSIIFNGINADPAEQARLDEEQSKYFRNHK